MGSMMGGVGSGLGVWSPAVVLVAIAVLLAARWALSGGSRRQDAEESRPADWDTPGAILRRRYAAGEIDEDEYLRILAGLSQR